MLLSANTSDVTEALRFFVQARHFQLPCAVTGMKRALALMWSTEQSIRDEVLKAFVDGFIAEPGTEGGTMLPDNQIAKNLLVLTGQASVSELASIEEAINRLVLEERIPADVFLILWLIASRDPTERQPQLLSMGRCRRYYYRQQESTEGYSWTLDWATTLKNKDWRIAGACMRFTESRSAKVDKRASTRLSV
jgi:hypothetical protein